MKRPTTIAEATAVCPGRYCGGITKVVPPLPDCPECNGTGYACGVKPTEVQQALFDAMTACHRLQALRLEMTVAERDAVDAFVEVIEICHESDINLLDAHIMRCLR